MQNPGRYCIDGYTLCYEEELKMKTTFRVLAIILLVLLIIRITIELAVLFIMCSYFNDLLGYINSVMNVIKY